MSILKMNGLRQRAFPIIMGTLVGVILLFITTQPSGRLIQQADRAFLENLARFGSNGGTRIAGPDDDGRLSLAAYQASPVSEMDFVLITDDPAEIFEETPPSAIDFALLLSTLRKAGAENVSVDYPLSWTAADPIETGLLELELERLRFSALAFPVSRSSEGTSLPEQWLASTLKVEDFPQLPPSLPVVNRLAVEPTTFGSQSTLLGFTRIESELHDVQLPYLLARWDDRILLSSLLTSLLLENNLSINDLRISRDSITLEPINQFISIDRYGRALLNRKAPLHSAVAAEDIIAPSSGEAGSYASSRVVHISSDKAERTANLLQISSSDRLTPIKNLRKVPLWLHSLGVLFLSLTIVLLRPRGSLWKVASLVLSGGLLLLILTGLLQAGVWTSTVSVLGTALVACLFPIPPKIPESEGTQLTSAE